MGFFGFTVFQQLYYVSAHYTTGVNLAIIQGVSPVLMLIGGWVLWGARVTLIQIGGFALTLVGVALVATRGDLAVLRDFDFRIGDLGVLGSAIVYSGYALSLRDRPKASALGFFLIMVFAGFFTSLPMFIWEVLAGGFIAPTYRGWMVLLYAVIFPSVLAQLFFIRSVEIIGPSRVALFYNVTPVMGAIFAVVVLSEPFELHQAVALALVIGGVIIAERLGKKP
jgi:drug/metabolite transporter (DMT)-like permease